MTKTQRKIDLPEKEMFNTAMKPLPNLVVVYLAYTKPVLLAVWRG